MKNSYDVIITGKWYDLLSSKYGLSYRDAISVAHTGAGFGKWASYAMVYNMMNRNAVLKYAWNGDPSDPNSKWVRVPHH